MGRLNRANRVFLCGVPRGRNIGGVNVISVQGDHLKKKRSGFKLAEGLKKTLPGTKHGFQRSLPRRRVVLDPLSRARAN